MPATSRPAASGSSENRRPASQRTFCASCASSVSTPATAPSHPDAATTGALRAGAAGLKILSPERVWSEIKRVLLAPDPVASLRLAEQLGVLGAVLPGADGLDRLAALVAAGAPADPLLRLAALTGEDADTLAGRWRLSNPERDTLTGLRRAPPATDPASLRRALADATTSLVAGRLWLAGADPRVIASLPEPPVFPLQGRDLIAAGASPGPALGQHLAMLRAAWLDGGCVADADIADRAVAVRDLARPARYRSWSCRNTQTRI